LAPPDAAAASKYNAPSEYSKRYTLAGEVKLMLRRQGTAYLPNDIWEWYMQRTGRSELSNSVDTYIKAFMAAYGDRLQYDRSVGLAMSVVKFRESMLSW
jgi:hypothetical protein